MQHGQSSKFKVVSGGSFTEFEVIYAREEASRDGISLKQISTSCFFVIHRHEFPGQAQWLTRSHSHAGLAWYENPAGAGSVRTDQVEIFAEITAAGGSKYSST